jgi:hypothetical protein
MRSCPRCGQALTQDDIRCPSCRTSTRHSDGQSLSVSVNKPPRDSDGQRPNLPLGIDPNQPLQLDALGRTKTLLGHGVELPNVGNGSSGSAPPNSKGPSEIVVLGDESQSSDNRVGADSNSPDRGSTPAPNSADQRRIEPAPMVTVLGVPIPRSPSSKPSQPTGPWQPINAAATLNISGDNNPLKKTLTGGSWNSAPQTTRGVAPSSPVLAPEGRYDPTQTLQGFRSIDVDSERPYKDQQGSNRLRSSGRPGPWVSENPGGSVVAPYNADTRFRDQIPPNGTSNGEPNVAGSPKLLPAGYPVNPAATPMGSVHQRPHTLPTQEVESLFYYLDSQVLGLPPPSRASGAPNSSSPPASTRSSGQHASRRNSQRIARVSLRNKRILQASGVIIVVAISIIAWKWSTKMQPTSKPVRPSLPALPSSK